MNRFLNHAMRAGALALAMTLTTGAMAQKAKQEKVMTKEKGAYVVNTTTLCPTKGFKGTTPLKVTIKKNKIVSVEALDNQETPKFFGRVVKEMLPKYADQKVTDIDKVDAVTGATRSSKAVKDNVKAAVEYFQKNK